MSTYIYIKNYYLEEIKTIIQEHLNSIYHENSTIEVEILMKNSRTYFIKFNEELAFEELLDWINTFFSNKPSNERITIIEGYQPLNKVDYKYYFIEDNLFANNSKNQVFKIEHFEELILIESKEIIFDTTPIPNKNIHSMLTLKFEKPLKKWWKFWKKQS